MVEYFLPFLVVASKGSAIGVAINYCVVAVHNAPCVYPVLTIAKGYCYGFLEPTALHWPLVGCMPCGDNCKHAIFDRKLANWRWEVAHYGANGIADSPNLNIVGFSHVGFAAFSKGFVLGCIHSVYFFCCWHTVLGSLYLVTNFLFA